MPLWRSGIRRPESLLRRGAVWKVTPRYIVIVWKMWGFFVAQLGCGGEGGVGVYVYMHLHIPECTQFVKHGVVCHVTLWGLMSFVIYLA